MLYYIYMDILKRPKQKSPAPIDDHYKNSWNNTNSYSETPKQTKAEDDISNVTTLEELLEYKQHVGSLIQTSDQAKGTVKKKLFWFSAIIFIFAILFAGGFFIHQTNNTINQITDSDKKHSFIKTVTSLANPKSYKKLNGFSDGRINILLLGRANTHKSGKDLTDTIMMLSVNTIDYNIGLFSIPRDFLVETHSNASVQKSSYVKINSRYQTGLRNDEGAKYIINSVETLTAQDIHYYFVLDFEGFKKIINLLGGINIDVPHHIKDERYPGPGYSYETFEVYPGLQKFDGATALKYARTRHDAEGDFGRAARQQQVMQSARNKAFSLGTIVNPLKINELLKVLGNHVHTDISPDEIEPFISLVKKLDTHNITNIVIDAWKPGSLLISARYYSDHGGISGLVPRSGNYIEIQEQADNLFDLNKIQKRKDELKRESAKIVLINTTGDAQITNNVKKTLTSLGFENITISRVFYEQQQKTTVADYSGGTKNFTLDELLKKLPAQKNTLSETIFNNVDFVILLGDDIVDTYAFTEISQEELEQENTN